MSGAPSGTPATGSSGNGSDPSTAASNSSTDTAAVAVAGVAVVAATTQPAAVTPASTPDPVAAAAAGGLAALLDVAGDQQEEGHVRVEACLAIQKYVDDAVLHALIDSIPIPTSGPGSAPAS